MRNRPFVPGGGHGESSAHPAVGVLPLAAVARSGGVFTFVITAMAPSGGTARSEPSSPVVLGVPLQPTIVKVQGSSSSALAILFTTPQQVHIPAGPGVGTGGKTFASQPFEFVVVVR